MNEEKRNGLFTTIIVCLFVILCFGFLRNPGTPAENTKKPDTNTYNPKTVSSTVHAAPTSYTLRLEEEKLNLYLNSDGEVRFMESFEIDSSLFPQADIDELKTGVTLPGLVDIVSVIEDFTS